ncbi:MAG: NADH-quinone oxidoreductase subunit N [Motiliproteus sp.]
MNTSTLNSTEFFSLLPIILISVGLLALMMVIAIKRSAKMSFQITLATLAISFISLFIIQDLLPQQATPLLLIDSYGVFFMGLILITAMLLLPLCYDYWKHHNQIQDEFYLLYLISILGALVLISSSHFAAFFLGLELLSLPIIIMVGYPFFSHYSASMESATKYLILSAAASATLMFGVALIYSQYGTLEFIPLTDAIASQSHSPHTLVKVGTIMLLIGIAFKLSLVPFHLWTPDVYQGAPLPATAFLATISKGAVFALLLRFYLSSEVFLTESLVWSIAAIAIASMLVGNLLALFQESIKRLLAYSSIAHFGYLLVALLAISQSIGADIAIEAVAYYLVAYLLSTLAAFAVLMRLPGLKESTDAPRLDSLSGLFWSHPVLAAILTLAMLSLAGIPLTVGFIGKFYIFAAAVEESLWGILLIAIIGSGIGLFYYMRVILVMTYSVSHQDTETYLYPGQSGRVVLAIVALLTVWLGIYPAPLIELIREMTLVVF